MGVKMLGKILGGLMVLGITTIPAPLVAASKLEITDPRAAKIKEIVTLPSRESEQSRAMVRSSSSQTTVGLSLQGRFTMCGVKNPSARCRKCVMSPTVCISKIWEWMLIS